MSREAPQIAIVGDWRHPIFEDAMARALTRAGASVTAGKYGRSTSSGVSPLEVLAQRHPNPISSRIATIQIRRSLGGGARHILVWRGEPLSHTAVQNLRRLARGGKLVYFSNDSIFAPEDGHRWRYVLRNFGLYDIVLAFRRYDLDRLTELGVHAQLWLPGFDPHYLGAARCDELKSRPFDVVFVGHFEDDGRAECVSRLSGAGLRVGVWGQGWPRIAHVEFRPPAYGMAYSDAVSSGRLGLVFLSKRNFDEVTYRSFELPYLGTPMLSEATPLMRRFFQAGHEAYFFSSAEECLQVAMVALRSDLEAVRARARARVAAVGGSVDDRARELIQMLASGSMVG